MWKFEVEIMTKFSGHFEVEIIMGVETNNFREIRRRRKVFTAIKHCMIEKLPQSFPILYVCILVFAVWEA